LLHFLTREDEAVCANAQAALACLGERWGKSDPRSGDLVQQAVKGFPHLSLAGQIAVLRLTEDWAGSDAVCPECLVCASTQLLANAKHLGHPALLGPSVELALTILPRSKRPDLLCAASAVAHVALTAPDAAVRVRALRLAIYPGIDL